MKTHNWARLSLVVSALGFLLLTQLLFGLGEAHIPIGRNWELVFGTWLLAGCNVLIKILTGCFECHPNT